MNIEKNRWSPEQLECLARMADQAKSEGRQPNYALISIAVGHTILACSTRMAEIRKRRRNAEEKARLAAAGIQTAPTVCKKKRAEKTPPLPAPRVIIPTRRVADYTSLTVATSTHMLVADAELRARIAIVGLTAGLLGDPPPGRSALDQKRQQSCGSGGRGSGSVR